MMTDSRGMNMYQKAAGLHMSPQNRHFYVSLISADTLCKLVNLCVCVCVCVRVCVCVCIYIYIYILVLSID